MNRTMTAAAFVTGVLLAGPWMLAQNRKADHPEVQLQAAMHTEMVDGNIKAAIEQYKKVAQTNNRAIAAKALIRMAQCYQKLGDAESKKIYERVLREYSDQPDAVRQARAALGPDEKDSAALTARQVWSGEGVDIEGQPSPDGRYQVFVDWRQKGNLAIRELSTGSERLLTHDAGEQFAYWGAIFSPDGKQIAYQWCCDQIRIIQTDGTRGRVLVRDQNSYPLQPAAWSPDGKHIAALIGSRADRVNRIVLISVADGSVTTLKTVGWTFPWVGDFSADGRFLAYSVPATKTAKGGVYALAVDGSREIPLVEGPSDFKAPAWTPDGKSVVFPSNRSGAPALWTVTVNGGRPVGAPELVKAGVGDVQPMRFTHDGSYFYGVRNRQQDIYVANFDPQLLTFVSQPARLSEQCIGCDAGPSWSPDGKRIAFLRTASGRTALVVRSTTGGNERPISHEFESIAANFDKPRWLGTDAFLIVDSVYTADRRKLWSVDVDRGTARLLLDAPFGAWPPGDVSPDGKKLFYSIGERSSKADTWKLRLIRRELNTGSEKVLYEMETNGIGFFAITASPDGGRVAFMANVGYDGRAVYVIPESGGTPVEIYRGSYEDPLPQTMAWTKNGQHLIVVQKVGANAPKWRAIPVDCGDSVIVDPKLRFDRLAAPTLSPDGRRIAFAGTRNAAELWVVKNLVPNARPSR